MSDIVGLLVGDKMKNLIGVTWNCWFLLVTLLFEFHSGSVYNTVSIMLSEIDKLI